MNRLRRFYERASGIKSSRAAYVIDPAELPEARLDAKWTEDLTFRPAEAVLLDPGLKPVYLVALAKGCVIVTNTIGENEPN
jgi:hypothetical protein